ncbi:hypothetical protein [Indioceanicola profundi]|uniref:hypothetical protein n=1 Tax=Indioceanicola profundi TaxID=2220096 RepID=UPI0013C45DE8|nr:hypothetical protein [Indioceanicola profundi]
MARKRNSIDGHCMDRVLKGRGCARKHMEVFGSGMTLLKELARLSRGSDGDPLPSMDTVVAGLQQSLPDLDRDAGRRIADGKRRSNFWYGAPSIPLAVAIGRLAKADPAALPSMLLMQALERLVGVAPPFACQNVVPADGRRPAEQADALVAVVDDAWKTLNAFATAVSDRGAITEAVVLSAPMAQAIDLSRNRMASASRLIVSRRSWIEMAIMEKLQMEAAADRRKGSKARTRPSRLLVDL